MSKYWIALIIAISANIIANTALKHAALGSGEWTWSKLAALLLMPTFWLGIFGAGVLFAAYVYAIRGVPLSIAYPLVTGLAMAGIAVASHFSFGESLSALKLLGLGLVVAGVAVLSYSSTG